MMRLTAADLETLGLVHDVIHDQHEALVRLVEGLHRVRAQLDATRYRLEQLGQRIEARNAPGREG